MKTTIPFSAPATYTPLLKANMHKLWEAHIACTRHIISCLTDEIPGIENAMKHLLRSQMNIGNAIKPYYGAAAGKKLTELLAVYGHINIMAAVVKTAKIGNTESLDEANKKWHVEANKIAQFLNKTIPEDVFKEIKTMLLSPKQQKTNAIELHIKQNISEAAFINNKLPEKLKATALKK